MPKFAANLTMLFQEAPFLERFSKARAAGFNYVEYLFPYQWDAEILSQKLLENNLQQVLFNLPAGDWERGDRGIACIPNRKKEFKQGLELAVHYARALNVSQVNCLAGLKPESITHDMALNTFTENLHFAADYLYKENIQLLIEPINSLIDIRSFFLDRLDMAAQIIDAVDHPNLSLQFDIYHTNIMHGNVVDQFHTYFEKISHIQFADSPGRHEPGTGNINFQEIFNAIDRSNYDGFVSAEYIPAESSAQSLNWLQTFN